MHLGRIDLFSAEFEKRLVGRGFDRSTFQKFHDRGFGGQPPRPHLKPDKPPGLQPTVKIWPRRSLQNGVESGLDQKAWLACQNIVNRQHFRILQGLHWCQHLKDNNTLYVIPWPILCHFEHKAIRLGFSGFSSLFCWVFITVKGN